MSASVAFVVVDTDVISYILKHDTRTALYAPHLQGKSRYLSFATVAEPYFWAEDRRWGLRLRNRLEAIIRTSNIVDSNEALCRLRAQVCYTAKQIGRPIQPNDAWIAATALYLDAPLVTRNRRDFAAVPGLRLLSEAT